MLAMAEGFILLVFKQSVKKKTEEEERLKHGLLTELIRCLFASVWSET